MELLIQSNPYFTRPPSADHIIFSPPKTKPISLSFKSSHQHRINSIPFSLLKTDARFTISVRSSLAQLSTSSPPSTHWMVVMQKPPNAESSSRAEIIDYYSQTLAKVLPSEKEAQMCIYRASWQSDFFFCCDIDEASSRELACLPEVLSVRPESDLETVEKDHSFSDVLLAKKSNPDTRPPKFSPSNGNSDYWLVKVEKPGVEVVTKAQMVDYFAQTLTKVLGNEKDAQACIYNISWEKDFGFCCQIDEESARELSGVPGVLYVQTDLNFESENKNYKVEKDESDDSAGVSSLPEVKTKRLFVTGLSFYTSEKTLRTNFEPFGELVEVKVIMDKISKRSKGYAFIEYTTEEAAAAALKEMNGKIINGWMIVVDVAKTNPPKYSRARPRQPFSSSSSTY